MDETTDLSSAAQLEVVLRYVTDKAVKEWFVRFEDVTSGNEPMTLLLLMFVSWKNMNVWIKLWYNVLMAQQACHLD